MFAVSHQVLCHLLKLCWWFLLFCLSVYVMLLCLHWQSQIWHFFSSSRFFKQAVMSFLLISSSAACNFCFSLAMSLSMSVSFAKLFVSSPGIVCSVLSRPRSSLIVRPSVCVRAFLTSGSSEFQLSIRDVTVVSTLFAVSAIFCTSLVEDKSCNGMFSVAIWFLVLIKFSNSALPPLILIAEGL